MKAVIAMDSFKGCMNAIEACNAAAQGVLAHDSNATTIILPMSDGGDGMLDAYVHATHCSVETIDVSGPLPGTTIKASIGFYNDTAIIESAQACGLALVQSDQRNPMKTQTHGVGEMLRYVISKGYKRVIIGLGGSATNDLGIGMLSTLGIKFYNKNGHELKSCTENIDKIHALEGVEDVKQLCNGVTITIASDVTSPLMGPNGAAMTFAPQKGATPCQVQLLENMALQFNSVVSAKLGNDYSVLPGAGAAGGLGYALMAFLNGTFASGAKLLLDIANFEDIISDAQLVITGEGKSDRQTVMGKLPGEIVRIAAKKGIKTILLSGQIEDTEVLTNAGFYAIKSINKQGTPLEEAMNKDVARSNLMTTTHEVISQIS